MFLFMKKIILILFFAITTFSTTQAAMPVKWGAVAGLNLTDMKGDLGDKIKVGFHVGAKAELALTGNLFLDGRLLFTQKGYKSDNMHIWSEDGTTYPVERNAKNYYMELPIHIGYKFDLHKDFSIFISGGGYLGLGMFGKDKFKYNGQKESYDLYKSGRGDKRFDCGIGARAGVEVVKKVQISASYDFGLTNINKYSYGGAKHRNLMISCAYLF